MTTEVSKPWWHSRTVWFNTITAILASLELSFGVLQPVLPPQWYAAVVLVVTVGNIILRTITVQGLR